MSRIQTVVHEGSVIHIKEAEFKCGTEEWSEYTLDNGTLMRVKAIIDRVYYITEKDGKLKYHENGEPMIRVSHSVRIITRPGRLVES